MFLPFIVQISRNMIFWLRVVLELLENLEKGSDIVVFQLFLQMENYF